jgi:hypothetical protein
MRTVVESDALYRITETSCCAYVCYSSDCKLPATGSKTDLLKVKRQMFLKQRVDVLR